MVLGECFLVLFNDHMTSLAVVEVWLNDEVSAVSQLSMTPDHSKLDVHGEDGLVPILRGEGEGVVARLVQEVQSGAIKNQTGIMQTGNVNVDEVARQHGVLLTQGRKQNTLLIKDRGEELCLGKGGKEEQQEHDDAGQW